MCVYCQAGVGERNTRFCVSAGRIKKIHAKAMDLNDPCLQVDAPCTVRLHVGGLGPSVISSDLVQIFSSLAKVLCVDVVNTKGRYFAYVTIQAASRDIKRLFSLYNGCTWKGGRLKLEKAKEFYLDKLRREWADLDCLQDSQTPKLKCVTTAKSVVKSTDSSSFKIYVPKLRKVKPIPEKGLGKHKRSFERVDPLPYSLLQICDCEQHRSTTSKYQIRSRNEPFGMAEEKGIKGSKHATIKASTSETSRECESLDKASGYKGRKAFEKKPGVYRKIGDGWGSNEVHALGEPVLNIQAGSAHSDKGEPSLNMAGFNDFCNVKLKDSAEEEEACAISKEQAQACVEDAQQVVEGVGCRERKRFKSDLTGDRNKDPGEVGKFTDLSSQRGKANESKAVKNSRGRSWVQKASWKSLVGETGRMSFSLGSMLNVNVDGNLER